MIQKLYAIAGRVYRSVRPVRSESYLSFVRTFACVACGTQSRRRDAMHTGPHGIGQKASDLDTVPGCRRCHQQLHRLGPVRFQMLHGLDFKEAIESIQLMYIIRHGSLPGEDQERRAA